MISNAVRLPLPSVWELRRYHVRSLGLAPVGVEYQH